MNTSNQRATTSEKNLLKKYKKENLKLNLTLFLYFFGFILLSGFVVYIRLEENSYIKKGIDINTFDYPVLSLYKESIKSDNSNYGLLGDYNKHNNVIRIDVTKKDVLNTIYHEYAHHIYYNKMNTTERYYYESNLCNKTLEIEGYEKKDWCSEQFARGMANYIEKFGWEVNMLPGWENIPGKFNFTEKIYKGYVQ